MDAIRSNPAARRARWWPCLLVLPGCAAPAVEVTPLRGPAPAAVVVLPVIDATGLPGRNLRPLLAGCDRLLRERGYRALPIDVGLDLLAAAGDQGLHPGTAVGADAALELTVRYWHATGERALVSASWDLQWRLVGLRDGAELWSHGDQGTWQAPRPERPDFTQDPLADTMPPVVFGAGPTQFVDEQELAFALHRQALLRLPRRP